MVEYTHCMSVWQTRVVAPSHPDQEQQDALEMLYDAAFLAPKYLYETPDAAYVESVRKAREVIAEKKAESGNRIEQRPCGSAEKDGKCCFPLRFYSREQRAEVPMLAWIFGDRREGQIPCCSVALQV